MSSRTKKRLKAARKQAAADLGQSYISRNDPCPCGSGKKAKHCCLNKIKALKALPPAVREQVIANAILGQPTFAPQPVPAAVAAQFAAVQAQVAPVADAPAATPEPITLPIVSGTIKTDGGDPVQLTGGTLTINPPDAQTTEAQTP